MTAAPRPGTLAIPAIPAIIRTKRLILERWRPAHAPLLQPALEESAAHLEPWIPSAVAEPAPLPQLEERMRRFESDFDTGQAWVFAILPRGDARVLGGVGVYPRDATGRVPIGLANYVEVGYWLRVSACGYGYASEAAQAMLGMAATIPGMSRAEMRCDERNVRSIAVPRRLGFHLAGTVVEEAAELGAGSRVTQLWERTLLTAGHPPLLSEEFA